jgi:hypothetical protein
VVTGGVQVIATKGFRLGGPKRSWYGLGALAVQPKGDVKLRSTDNRGAAVPTE